MLKLLEAPTPDFPPGLCPWTLLGDFRFPAPLNLSITLKSSAALEKKLHLFIFATTLMQTDFCFVAHCHKFYYVQYFCVLSSAIYYTVLVNDE